MITVSGYICIASFSNVKILYGHGKGKNGFGNFEANGLRPFRTEKAAQKVVPAIQAFTGVKKVFIVRIRMRIAENGSELVRFRTKNNLVVIWKGENKKENRILGPLTSRARGIYPLPGALFKDNGLNRFRMYEDAEHVAKEVNRQAQSPATIAEIEILPLSILRQ